MHGKQIIFNQSQRRPQTYIAVFIEIYDNFSPLVTGGQDCDYDEIRVVYVFEVVCEGDVGVIISYGEFPDLVRVHVKADDPQMSRRHASASGSPT